MWRLQNEPSISNSKIFVLSPKKLVLLGTSFRVLHGHVCSCGVCQLCESSQSLLEASTESHCESNQTTIQRQRVQLMNLGCISGEPGCVGFYQNFNIWPHLPTILVQVKKASQHGIGRVLQERVENRKTVNIHTEKFPFLSISRFTADDIFFKTCTFFIKRREQSYNKVLLGGSKAPQSKETKLNKRPNNRNITRKKGRNPYHHTQAKPRGTRRAEPAEQKRRQ